MILLGGCSIFEIYLLSRWAFLPKANQLRILHVDLNVECKLWPVVNPTILKVTLGMKNTQFTKIVFRSAYTISDSGVLFRLNLQGH